MSAPTSPSGDQDARERRWQVILVVVFLAVIAAAVRLSGAFDSDDAYDPIPSTEQAYSVIDALAVAGRDPIAVQGYVFDGSARGLRLCTTREPGDPPRCVGPYLSIEGVDAGFVVLEPGTDADGHPMAHHDGLVTLVGVIDGTIITVTDVLEAQ